VLRLETEVVVRDRDGGQRTSRLGREDRRDEGEAVVDTIARAAGDHAGPTNTSRDVLHGHKKQA
jgi:hypothetical protein